MNGVGYSKRELCLANNGHSWKETHPRECSVCGEKEYESAQPCGCDFGANHICDWHASHGLSLPKKAVPEVSQAQRANQEQARVNHQFLGTVPSPDTFVDVARPRTAQEVSLTAQRDSTQAEAIAWRDHAAKFHKANPSLALPTDPKARKQTPIYSGVLRYFPKALAEVARVSYAGNEQHNPGEPLHWAREKSTDQHDCIVRHLLEAGTRDTDGMLHSAKVCWRSLAALELELEAAEREKC